MPACCLLVFILWPCLFLLSTKSLLMDFSKNSKLFFIHGFKFKKFNFLDD